MVRRNSPPYKGKLSLEKWHGASGSTKRSKESLNDMSLKLSERKAQKRLRTMSSQEGKGGMLDESLNRWMRIQSWLGAKRIGRKLLAILRVMWCWWGLVFIPAFKKITLPGCAGVPLINILGHFTDRDLWQSAKALSYSFLIAIPPMLVFLFSSIAYFPVDGVQDQLLSSMQQFIPEGIYGRVADTINDIMGHKHGSLLSIGFVTSIVLAANGMYGMMMSFNFMDHENGERPLWLRYVISLVLVLLLYSLIVVLLTLLIGYQLLEKLLISRNILAESWVSLFLFNFGRWVILIFVTLLIISIIYYIAPIRKRRISFFSFGSVLSTLLFFALAWAFQAYLRVFNNYNILYGSIGTLLVLMLWVYANCVVILVGYGINIAIADARGEQGITYKINRKKTHGTKFKQPNHRPALRTDTNGFRQRHGSTVWFGAFGSIRYPRFGSSNGKNDNKQP